MNRAELQSPPIEHRVVGLAVHGIGEQPLGNTLKHVLSGFLPLVRLIDPEAGISARPLDKGDPSDVVIRFRGQSQKTGKLEGYEITFKEAWWATTFEPPSIWEIVAGVPSLVTNIVRRQGASKPMAAFWLVKAAVQRVLLGWSFDRIAESNGFVLLSDGVHLGETAAELTADRIEGWLRAREES